MCVYAVCSCTLLPFAFVGLCFSALVLVSLLLSLPPALLLDPSFLFCSAPALVVVALVTCLLLFGASSGVCLSAALPCLALQILDLPPKALLRSTPKVVRQRVVSYGHRWVYRVMVPRECSDSTAYT